MAQKVLLKIGSGDPVKEVVEEKATYNSRGSGIHKSLDLRDRIAELVGKGNALNPDDKAGIYKGLSDIVGIDKAQKIMNHAFIFNSRPDVQKLPIEEKLKTFYTIGSSDPDVTDAITKTKNLGYGVIPGFRSSVSDINQQLSGRIPTVAGSGINPEIQKKVLLKISK